MPDDDRDAAPALRLRGVGFAWPARRRGFGIAVEAFDLPRGARLLLLGESGSGKSTLLSLICGIVSPQSGEVLVDGTDIARMRGTRRDRFRAERIGVIFQQFNLLPYAPALDNILLPLRFAPERRARLGDARAEAMRLAETLGLARADLLEAPAARLSVGQQQRVAVARALIGRPPLIVADEPTSALDAASQSAFLDLLFEQCAAAGSTLLMVSHDERLAPRFDRSLRLEEIAEVTRGEAA